jgi:NAD(P)-dependent dehydrogenase (short-subunit alcohol dehydrogenase family)
VHNAGIFIESPLGKVTMADFDRTYNVNVRGPLLLMQAAEDYLPRDRSGRIVCVSSTSSTCGLKNQTTYGGSKAALEAQARTWARELSERCTVNSVNPGPVRTEMLSTITPELKENIRPFAEHAPLMKVREGVDSNEVIEDAKSRGGRSATVEEVANVVGMLCMPDAAWITGQVISANGGFIFGLS